MSAPTLEQRFTSLEVATALRMDIQTLRRKARTGEIDSEKSGRTFLFTQAHIDAYLRGDRPAPAPKASKASRNPNRAYKN